MAAYLINEALKDKIQEVFEMLARSNDVATSRNAEEVLFELKYAPQVDTDEE